MTTEYKLIYGSSDFFNNYTEDLDYVDLSELVKISDQNQNHNEIGEIPILTVPNSTYLGLTESAMDRIGNIIDWYTDEDSVVYIHNPTNRLERYLANKDIEVITDDRPMIKGKDDFKTNINYLSESIVGQDYAIKEIIKSLWYLKESKRKKPYVIMLYGNSGLGKTELVNKISKIFYDEKLLKLQMSVYQQNIESLTYLFGRSPNRTSLAFDLLARESELLFLDEFDKCASVYYSAFYSLFDNSIYEDPNYTVNTENLVVFLTSNYIDEYEMNEALGNPIFNRIDKKIKFNDFTAKDIYTILINEIRARKNEYEHICSMKDVYKYVSPNVYSVNENGRTISSKVQNTIESILFDSINDSHDYQ